MEGILCSNHISRVLLLSVSCWSVCWCLLIVFKCVSVDIDISEDRASEPVSWVLLDIYDVLFCMNENIVIFTSFPCCSSISHMKLKQKKSNEVTYKHLKKNHNKSSKCFWFTKQIFSAQPVNCLLKKNKTNECFFRVWTSLYTDSSFCFN